MEDVLVSDSGEIGAVWDVLSDEFVGILDEAFLPGRVGMGEKDFSMQHSGDVFVLGKLCSVVGGNGEDVVLKGFKKLYDKLCHGLCVFASRGFCHQ